MPFGLLYFFCCVGIAVCVVGTVFGIVRLFNRQLTVRRNRHWKKRQAEAEVWLGQWGA